MLPHRNRPALKGVTALAALAGLVLMAAPAHAESVDLRTFKKDTEGGRIQLSANLATLTQVTRPGAEFQGHANIFSPTVKTAVSFEYKTQGDPSVVQVAIRDKEVDLEPTHGRWSTYRFPEPFSGTLAFSIQGKGGDPAPVVPGTGTLILRNLAIWAPETAASPCVRQAGKRESAATLHKRGCPVE